MNNFHCVYVSNRIPIDDNMIKYVSSVGKTRKDYFLSGLLNSDHLKMYTGPLILDEDPSHKGNFRRSILGILPKLVRTS